MLVGPPEGQEMQDKPLDHNDLCHTLELEVVWRTRMAWLAQRMDPLFLKCFACRDLTIFSSNRPPARAAGRYNRLSAVCSKPAFSKCRRNYLVFILTLSNLVSTTTSCVGEPLGQEDLEHKAILDRNLAIELKVG
jgi:hypothetical protein